MSYLSTSALVNGIWGYTNRGNLRTYVNKRSNMSAFTGVSSKFGSYAKDGREFTGLYFRLTVLA
ncbi:MAG: hypothetical protein PUP90_17560 [Nostoc sp. S4]|nr:hypothetical protein [Nostoc sp. S4]